MKRNCGHEQTLNRWDEGYLKENDFIRINVSNNISLFIDKHNHWDSDIPVALVGCPKCKSVLFERYF